MNQHIEGRHVPDPHSERRDPSRGRSSSVRSSHIENSDRSRGATLSLRVWALSRQFVMLAHLRLRNRLTNAPVIAAGEENGKCVVSLTSHGPRIRTVYLAIESIARGKRLPTRLILWLDDDEAQRPWPATLRRLHARGLEIRYGANIGPHAKYYHFVDSHIDVHAPLVTADDDVMYPTYWLDGLFRAHIELPGMVHCYRALQVVMCEDGSLAPYRSWPFRSSSAPSRLNFLTGVSGVIYPTAMLRCIARAGKGFVDTCPRADDVWLNVLALRNAYPVKQVLPVSLHFDTIRGTQRQALLLENHRADGNDAQIRKTYTASDLAELCGPATATDVG